MIYLVHEQGLKLCVTSSAVLWHYKKKWCYKGFLRSFIYFALLNLSPRNVVLLRGTWIVSSKSRTGALVAKTKPMRDTFAPTHSQGSFLGCWLWEAGVSGFTPESPDFSEFRGLPRILWVLKPQRLYSGWGGYKSPLHPFLYSLSPAISTWTTSDLIYSLLYSLWLKFGEICCGDLRGFESKSLESASELISHL
jgi:hypothetical protein